MGGYIVTVLLEISSQWWKNFLQEAHLMLTNSHDAVKSSVKVTKHSTVPYVRYSFLLVWNSKFVFKTRRFPDIRIQKCRDLEIRVRSHWRSL